MIVSRHHRFIFVAIPRTGSQSIRFALRPHLGQEDWEQEDFDGGRRFPLAELASRGHGHLTIDDLRSTIGEPLRGYRSFAVLRDPCARYLSFANYRYGRNAVFRRNPAAFLKLLVGRETGDDRVFARPQIEYVQRRDGRMAVNSLLRFDRLETEFPCLTQTLGLPAIFLPKINSSRRQIAVGQLDAELRGMIEERYREDIALIKTASGVGAL
ncbi:MAG: hypothetical protein ACI9BV_003915 [Rhodothermales bacterium]|jgi:hypothetical protein